MSDELRQQIYSNFDMMETEYLLEIWQQNNRGDWTDLAFEVIEEILRKRQVEIPQQDTPDYTPTPVVEYEEDDNVDNADVESDSEMKYRIENREKVLHEILVEKLTTGENPPELYDPKEVLWLDKWLPRAAIVAIVLQVLVEINEVSKTYDTVWSYFSYRSGWDFVALLITLFLAVLIIVIQSVVVYFPLKSLAMILRLLMAIELKSRTTQ